MIQQHFKDEREKSSSVGLGGQTRNVKEKCKFTVAVVVVIGVVLRCLFFFNFKPLHNNFLFWLVSVFVRNLAGLRDL